DDVFRQMGMYTTVITTGDCDSIINLDLTVIPNPDTTLQFEICNGDTLIYREVAYFETGTYTVRTQSQAKCDSIITLILDVIDQFLVENDIQICIGDSIMVGDTVYNSTGMYVDTLISTGGCDSIIITDLQVNPFILNEIDTNICVGDSFIVGDNVYYDPGNYVDTLISNFGCDSIVDVTIDILDFPVYQNVIIADNTICDSNTAMIEVIATGTNLEYSIDNGLSWSDNNIFSNLAGGRYNVLIRPKASACVVVFEDNPISIRNQNSPVIDDVRFRGNFTCNGTSGLISIDAIGRGYQFSIDGGMTYSPNANFTNLPNGVYTVCVANVDTTCITCWEDAIVIEPGTTPTLLPPLVANPTSCASNNGTIGINTINLTGVYEFSIDGGLTWQASNVFNNLTNGIYTIMARSADGYCVLTYSENVVLQSPDAIVITLIQGTSPSACDSNDGEIIINVNDTRNTEFSIDGGLTWQRIGTFSNLPPGEYDIVVRNNARGCITFYPDPILFCQVIPPSILYSKSCVFKL
ncbi:MAG: hypothetical protein AAGK97_12160, partial [Bacteroidota bacterium]